METPTELSPKQGEVMRWYANRQIPAFRRYTAMLTTEPVHLASWCDDDERKDGLFIRFTDAFAGRWLLILCWGLFAGQYIQLGVWELMIRDVIPQASVIAFAEWLADMSWWFERILLK